jgi:hypothetical protein
MTIAKGGVRVNQKYGSDCRAAFGEISVKEDENGV